MWPINVMSFKSMLHVLYGDKVFFIDVVIVTGDSNWIQENST